MTLIILLNVLFVLRLFCEIVVSCITKSVTEPAKKMMTMLLEAADRRYSGICD